MKATLKKVDIGTQSVELHFLPGDESGKYFLKLNRDGENDNFGTYFMGSTSQPSSVPMRTRFSMIRIDPETLKVHTGDFTFAKTSGRSIGSSEEFLKGVAFGFCLDGNSPVETGCGSIDLRDTIFYVKTNLRMVGKNQEEGKGKISYRNKRQVVKFYGCGTSTSVMPEGDYELEDASKGGWFLELGVIGDSDHERLCSLTRPSHEDDNENEEFTYPIPLSTEQQASINRIIGKNEVTSPILSSNSRNNHNGYDEEEDEEEDEEGKDLSMLDMYCFLSVFLLSKIGKIGRFCICYSCVLSCIINPFIMCVPCLFYSFHCFITEQVIQGEKRERKKLRKYREIVEKRITDHQETQSLFVPNDENLSYNTIKYGEDEDGEVEGEGNISGEKFFCWNEGCTVIFDFGTEEEMVKHVLEEHPDEIYMLTKEQQKILKRLKSMKN